MSLLGGSAKHSNAFALDWGVGPIAFVAFCAIPVGL